MTDTPKTIDLAYEASSVKRNNVSLIFNSE